MESFACGPLSQSGIISSIDTGIEAMKNKGLKTVGLAIATTFAVVVANNNDVQAQALASNQSALKSNAKEITIKNPKYSVGIKDLRDDPLRVARIKAAALSKRAIVVFYMGNNEELANQVRAEASEAKDGGAPVRGMVLSKLDPKFEYGKSESYLIYVDGLPVTKQINPAHWPDGSIKEDIEWASKEYSEYLQASAKTAPEPGNE